jgi:RNA polymerase sigma-70 factor, ECF subfamily
MSETEFDTAVTDLSAKLRAFVRRRVRDDATADDLAQETLLKVYRSRATLRDGQRLEAWLYRIARRTLIDHYRRTRPSEELPATLAADAAGEGETPRAAALAALRAMREELPEKLETASSVEADAMRAAVVKSIQSFLEELPPLYREPVRLAEIEGLPLAKIALRLGLSLTAVKSRVRRGRAMLKDKLQACCRFEFDRLGRVIGYERRRKCAC